MTQSKIRAARLAARLSQAEVGSALGRSDMWVCLVERGRLAVSAELEARILTTIERLAALREAVRRSKTRLVEDLALPRARAGASIR